MVELDSSFIKFAVRYALKFLEKHVFFRFSYDPYITPWKAGKDIRVISNVFLTTCPHKSVYKNT